MRHAGIDEAGYGPLLGPLVVASTAAETDDWAAFTSALLAHGVRDSKSIHKTGSLLPLARVVVPGVQWLTGFPIETAADLFAVLGEKPEDRANLPWLAGAEDLRLPDLPPWDDLPAIPRGCAGHLVQPSVYNAERRAGINKADLEWRRVGNLLSRVDGRPQDTVVDRLGGRRYYADLLKLQFPGLPVTILEEANHLSRYDIAGHAVSFAVGGESVSPLTALASCIAKYSRELQMELLNRFWCGKLPWLKPTAGYPQDARRWLYQVGQGLAGGWRDELVRNDGEDLPWTPP